MLCGGGHAKSILDVGRNSRCTKTTSHNLTFFNKQQAFADKLLSLISLLRVECTTYTAPVGESATVFVILVIRELSRRVRRGLKIAECFSNSLTPQGIWFTNPLCGLMLLPDQSRVYQGSVASNTPICYVLITNGPMVSSECRASS